MNSANSYFEKKIFALGRYFWNLSVIVGAVSLGAGGILYLTSFPQKILKVNEWGWQTETLSGSYPEYKNKVEIKNYKNLKVHFKQSKSIRIHYNPSLI